MISEYCVLTAAHCVLRRGTKASYERILVGGGSTTWVDKGSLQTRVVPSQDHIFVHELFNWDPWNGYGMLGIYSYNNDFTSILNNGFYSSILMMFSNL